MLCSYCGVNVKGTPCQSARNASNCANNRGRENEDWGDDRITSFASREGGAFITMSLKDFGSLEKPLSD